MVSHTKMIKDESEIPKFIMDNKAKFVEKGIMIQ
jgi:hypothetical protein